MYSHREACRICGSRTFIPFADLGTTPLADTFSEDGTPLERYPLCVKVCRRCFLIQLVDVVDQSEVFPDEYGFFSGASPSLRTHFAEFHESVPCDVPGLVVEIASNDGELLRHYKDDGCRTLGIEPTQNTALEAKRSWDIDTIQQFFTEELAHEIVSEHGKANLVIANNVLAHVDNPVDFVSGVKVLLSSGGHFVAEVHHAQNLIFKNQFDNIYHEHLSFFSLRPLMHLFRLAGLEIYDAVEVPTQGGSLRVFATHQKQAPERTSRLTKLLETEEALLLYEEATYLGWQSRINYIAYTLRERIKNIVAGGSQIAAYGASAKSCTLLNFCGLDSSLISYVVDTTPSKFGRVTPGTNIPIVSEKEERGRADYYLLTVWNYLPDILKREAAYLQDGGHFIIPLPEVRVV